MFKHTIQGFISLKTKFKLQYLSNFYFNIDMHMLTPLKKYLKVSFGSYINVLLNNTYKLIKLNETRNNLMTINYFY